MDIIYTTVIGALRVAVVKRAGISRQGRVASLISPLYAKKRVAAKPAALSTKASRFKQWIALLSLPFREEERFVRGAVDPKVFVRLEPAGTTVSTRSGKPSPTPAQNPPHPSGARLSYAHASSCATPPTEADH